MNTLAQNHIQISPKDLSKILKAYAVIGEFLEHFVDRQLLYRNKFMRGLDKAIKEVNQQKTKRVTNFKEFIS